MTVAASSWLVESMSDFGRLCKEKLAGPGDREAAIRSPLEGLLSAVGEHLDLKAVFHDEVRDVERRIRPDYGVSVHGVITGYVEVKAPGRNINPSGFTGHDKKQWDRQKDLPNLIYTNGTDWRLYRDSELIAGTISATGGSLEEAGGLLTPPAGLESLLTDFLRWKPAPITSVGSLVRAVAPLTRLLRGEVLDQLESEDRRIRQGEDEITQPFHGLAGDWRALLFPHADNRTFADGYAQTVTFGLLLARTEGISLENQSLHSVGQLLGSEHSLMGKALQLLTDDIAGDFKVTLDLLVRVIGAVDWAKIRKGRRDTYLHLYENFLELYDNDLRKASGSYYTPREVVDDMVRLTEEALVSHLDRAKGFRDPSVLTVDPAMGTGTFLHTILENVADAAAVEDGPGAVAGAVTQAAERLIGFELQMGPYAVAELRANDLLASHGASLPAGGLKLFVTDTLDDPSAEETQLGSGMQLIAQARRNANRVKAKSNVTVVIGNPPYKELAAGSGGWVESGSAAHGKTIRPILEDFFSPDMAQYKAKLKNLYIYFWRWATWKTWESSLGQLAGDAGVVCFISTSGYVAGRPFTAMREYLRRHASHGWIIDLTPEGQTPDVPTRIFPGVRQPLCIGLFIRKPNTGTDTPAVMKYAALTGKQAEKYDSLSKLKLESPIWRPVRSEWTAPFTPAALSHWDDYPALDDLMPWYSPGVFPARTWIYSPSPDLLRRRWASLISAADADKAELFKEGSEPRLNKVFPALPGTDTATSTTPLVREQNPEPTTPIRVGYRAFDRQWIIPDNRVIHRSRATLWAARQPGQAFVVELHTKPPKPGPAVIFSGLIPDFHHFKGSEGGRTLPMLHPDGSVNVAPGLVSALADELGTDVKETDVVAYIAAVVSHPGFTSMFGDELTTPGIRVPITGDPEIWAEAVGLGEEVIWVQTFGEAFNTPERLPGSVRFQKDDPRRIVSMSPVKNLPESMTYDSERQLINVGVGTFGPVNAGVWNYCVGGNPVLRTWFSSRKKEPGGKKTSPLDHLFVDAWEPAWTGEFIDLISLLTRLVDLEDRQATLLQSVAAGLLLSAEDLKTRGCSWPRSANERKPRFGLGAESQAPRHVQEAFVI